jgi:hypothetical protein
VPPLIIAAKSNTEKRNAQEHFEDLKLVLHLLFKNNIPIISYATDGTEVERQVQALLMANEPLFRTFHIPDPSGRGNDLDLDIPIGSFEGNPIVIAQDTKHFGKTLRNNVYSGARGLVMGNQVVCYEDVRPLGFGPDKPPMYPRDIERSDRQDDNAALRLPSSKSLEYLSKHHPQDGLGLIIYLFIFGELVDAFQNRSIDLTTRIIMALRAWYFLQIWIAYLAKIGLSRTQHCISREAIDIVRIIVQSLIGLVLIHRDHMPGDSKVPLLPWMHSTEACEHMFGLMRQKIKDFTYRDFLQMVDWLHQLMRAAMRRKSNPRARATGYSHIWSEFTGLDISSLLRFSTNGDISQASHLALAGAEQLWAALGVIAAHLYRQTHAGAPPQEDLPSISSLFNETKSDEEVADEEEAPERHPTAASSSTPARLRQLIQDHANNNSMPINIPVQSEQDLENIAKISVCLSVDEQHYM